MVTTPPVRFHLRMYSCDKCLRTTALWVPLPAPETLVLVGGGCEKCSTPANKFTRKGQV